VKTSSQVEYKNNPARIRTALSLPHCHDNETLLPSWPVQSVTSTWQLAELQVGGCTEQLLIEALQLPVSTHSQHLLPWKLQARDKTVKWYVCLLFLNIVWFLRLL